MPTSKLLARAGTEVEMGLRVITGLFAGVGIFTVVKTVTMFVLEAGSCAC